MQYQLISLNDLKNCFAYSEEQWNFTFIYKMFRYLKLNRYEKIEMHIIRGNKLKTTILVLYLFNCQIKKKQDCKVYTQKSKTEVYM